MDSSKLIYFLITPVYNVCKIYSSIVLVVNKLCNKNTYFRVHHHNAPSGSEILCMTYRIVYSENYYFY